MPHDFYIYNREAFARKLVGIAQDCAAGYRRNISQFNTANENTSAEHCAIAASNTGYFILMGLGYSHDDIKRFAAEAEESAVITSTEPKA